jgi:Activator of Hsp90 ATPase homolog 1-like protein.
MKKDLYKLDYVLKNGSAGLLWKCISTPFGLSEWFADDVEQKGQIYTFRWDNSFQDAEVLSVNPGTSIRFHWLDDPAEYYFEFSIDFSELTGSITLSVTDFADTSEKKGSMELWNSQIENLARRTGM